MTGPAWTPDDIPRRGRGRPPKGERAMTHSERQAMYRARTELTDAEWEAVAVAVQQYRDWLTGRPGSGDIRQRLGMVLGKLYRRRGDIAAVRNIRRFL
jgi:hypothetical protein